MEKRFMEVFGFLFPPGEWPPARLGAVFAALRFQTLEAGTVLLREGATCIAVPFVLEGSIRVYKSSESGREITLYRIEGGQSCILSSGCGRGLSAFPATVVAERRTSAAFMPTELARRLLSESETFRDFVFGQFAQRMAGVIELVEEVAFRHVDERLKEWLSSTAKANAVRATHQEIADHLGSSREVVSRILKDWEDRGLLELSRGQIELLSGFEKLPM